MIAVAEDVPRLRDGLGIPVPPGVAATFAEPATHPIEDLVLRWARTHGPFVASTDRRALRAGPGGRRGGLRRLVGAGHAGRRDRSSTCPAADVRDERRQYCHSQVLALIKRRTLAGSAQGGRAGRAGRVRAVPGRVAGRRLRRPRGTDAVLSALEQLSGYAMPASAVESVDPAGPGGGLLPGDAGRADHGRRGVLGRRRRRSASPTAGSAGTWPTRSRIPAQVEPAHYRSQELLAALGGGGAYFFDALLPSGVGLSRPGGVRRRAVGSGLGRPGHAATRSPRSAP